MNQTTTAGRCATCGEPATVTIDRMIGSARIACGCGARPVAARRPDAAAAEARDRELRALFAAEAREGTCDRCGASCEHRNVRGRYCPPCRPEARRDRDRLRLRRRYEERRRSRQSPEELAYRAGRRDLRATARQQEARLRAHWLRKAAEIERARAARLAELGRVARSAA